MLLEQAMAWCREQGADEVSLKTVSGNEAATGFYRRLGFEPLTVTWIRTLDGD